MDEDDSVQAEPMRSNLLMRLGMAAVSPLCICAKCPTYVGGKDPKVYCARGASPRPVEMRGCICAKCPVYRMMGLKDLSFCYYGAARVLKRRG